MKHATQVSDSLRRQAGPMFLLSLLWFLTGCSSTTFNNDYGKRRGSGFNGVGVLSEMYRQQGSRIVTWKRLSPKTTKQDTIIWAPTDYAGPTTEQIEFFEEWLMDGGGHTLVIVNRDYDAAIGHWQSALEDATGQQAIEVRRRLAIAEAEYNRMTPAEGFRECGWYKSNLTFNTDWAGNLEGPWSENLDLSNTRIYVSSTLTFPNRDYAVEHLLMEKGRPIVSRLTHPNWDDDNKVIVFANGSMVFNQPLVNHENRKIAARLVAASGHPKRVMFIEGASDQVPIRDTDASAPLMLQAFTVWPINFLMIHATLLGILFCISVFPIFGRPHEIANENISDFGKHVAAYGDMLHRVGAANYVRERLRQYREIMHGGGPMDRRSHQ